MNETETHKPTCHISYSDNSHILGIPFSVQEGCDAHMDIPILNHSGSRDLVGLNAWVRKVAFLQRAGIEFHLHYV